MTRTARTISAVLALSLLAAACSDSATAPQYQAPDQASMDGIGAVGVGGRSDSTSTSTTTSSDSTAARGIGMVGGGG